MNGETEHPEYTVEKISAADVNRDKKKNIRLGLFKKKNLTPDTFDFSISKEGNDKRMVLRIVDGKKEVTLNMNQDVVITLMAGLMDTAADLLEIEHEDKIRDVMYA